MSPDQWLASQQEEKPKGANVTIESAPVAELSPDQWLATQKTKAPTTSLSPDQWLAQQPQQPQETKTSNPFKRDIYILKPINYLYNKKIIKIFGGSIDTEFDIPERKQYEINSNEYRIENNLRQENVSYNMI